MKPVIKYLEDHPTLNGCNFTCFGENVSDLSTLVEYLKTARNIVYTAFMNFTSIKTDKCNTMLEETRAEDFEVVFLD